MYQTKILSPKSRQVMSAMSAGFLMVGMLITWGYPAAALPQMEQIDSPIHLSPQQSSWFATVTLLLCIPGSLIGASLYECLGPRRVMLAIIPMLWLSTCSMAFASWKVVQETGNAEVVLLSFRVIQGACVAVLMPFVSTYTYEVCDQNLRGTFASLAEAWATLGYLLCYIGGCFLHWSTIAWLLPSVILVPAFIGLLIAPDSPLWLAKKGREHEARVVLLSLRCTEKEAEADLISACNDSKENDATCLKSLQTLGKKPNLLSVIAGSLLMVMSQLIGFSIISIYIVHILGASNVGLDPRWSSVIVGSTRLIFSCFASFLIHRFPRKLLFTVGNILTGIATTALGTFFYMQSAGDDISWLSWLPPSAMVLYMIGYAGAVGPTTWTSSIEVLTGPVRSIGFGIASASFTATGFITTNLFDEMQQICGLYGVFWFFTSGSVLYIMLVQIFIPETHGKTLQDIYDYWNNSAKTDKSKELV